MKIRLTLLKGGPQGYLVKVKTSTFLIGRGEDCDLTLRSRGVSRQHCRLTQNAKGLCVEDLGSRNHTLVVPSGTDVKKAVVLTSNQSFRLWHGDKIQMGQLVFGLSLRDSQTNEAVVPEQSIDEELETLVDRNLLDELQETQSEADRVSNEINDDHAAESINVKEIETEEVVGKDVTEADPGDGPQRLPEHLRSKGPADSKDAADEVLRRLFSAES